MSSLDGVFSNGLSALMAQSAAMGSISDNIANLSTIGYKRADTQFATLLGEHDAPGNNPLAPSNDQNGVSASTRQLVTLDGSLKTTGNQYDLAISGSGMFVFGNFSASTTGTTTTQVVYGRAGNLDPTVPTAANGAVGSTVNGTTLSATSAFLANQNGQFLLAVPVANPVPGQTVTVATPTSTSGLVPIQTSNQAAFAGLPTSSATLAAVIPATGATSVSAPLSYIDSAGVQQSLTLTLSNPVVTNAPPAAPFTTWNVTATDANGNQVLPPVTVPATATPTMSFDDTGTAIGAPTFTVSATSTTFTGTAPTSSFTLDLSKLQMLGNATTTSNGSALAVNTNYTQNGLPAGAFEGIQINSDGSVIGLYAGGATQQLYQIPIASFASPDNLQTLAGNVYAPTQGSGAASFFLPGTGGPNLNLGAVEESNTDLGQSFTAMILTQQAYNSAAQVLQVANQMSSVVSGLQT